MLTPTVLSAARWRIWRASRPSGQMSPGWQKATNGALVARSPVLNAPPRVSPNLWIKRSLGVRLRATASNGDPDRPSLTTITSLSAQDWRRIDSTVATICSVDPVADRMKAVRAVSGLSPLRRPLQAGRRM